MAIAFDSASSAGAGTTSITVSHTCTGSNLVLFAGVKIYNGANPGDKLSTVTYNGVSMTQLTKIAQNSGTEFYLYGLLSPSTGANNLIATPVSSVTEIDIFGISYTGVLQSGLPDAINSANSPTSPNTISVTTVKDNCWLVGYFCSDNGSAVAAGTGTTQRANITYAGMSCDSNGAKTPAGSYSLQATGTTTTTGIVASFAPNIYTPHFLGLMGVGS